MTREEAIKYLQENRYKMGTGLMEAVETLVPEVQFKRLQGKDAILFWLNGQITDLDKLIPVAKTSNKRWVEFYKGKRNAYKTCRELLQRMENICIIVE